MANAKTGLYDIADLAYSPKSGKLYVVDFAWMDTSKGGLFRLDVKQDGDAMKVTAEKILSLDKPSALAFSPDGTLYVTVFGTAKEGASKKPGKLLKIEGDL
jgi:glucose/arabinose dehydrogenase